MNSNTSKRDSGSQIVIPEGLLLLRCYLAIQKPVDTFNVSFTCEYEFTPGLGNVINSLESGYSVRTDLAVLALINCLAVSLPRSVALLVSDNTPIRNLKRPGSET